MVAQVRNKGSCDYKGATEGKLWSELLYPDYNGYTNLYMDFN